MPAAISSPHIWSCSCTRDARGPGQGGHLATDVLGHQEGEVGRAPVGRQAELDLDLARVRDGHPLDEAEIGDRLVELGIVDPVEAGPDLGLAAAGRP